MMDKNWTDRLPDLLQDYQEAPPEGLWDAVNSGMVSRKRRIPAAVWYVAGGLAAAAAVALLLFLRPSAPGPTGMRFLNSIRSPRLPSRKTRGRKTAPLQ